jgi:hypothetical protein
MYGPQDETIIKLHTADDGNVWYARGINTSKNSEQIVDSFLLSSVVSGMGLTFRILGVRQNAELICALYHRRYKGEVRSVEIAGPNILDNQHELSDPGTVLMRMRSAMVSPACGGWHALTMHDYPTYAMLARLTRNNFVFDDTASSYLYMHPAYKALTFIPTLAKSEVAKLLVTTVDPRWYIDRRRPERIKKLELFLGLTPAIQERVSNPKRLLSKSRELRCSTVLRSWKSQEPEAVDFKLPENFLYRIWHAAGGGYYGDLRASQAFLRYLNDNWLAVLENRKGVKDGLFAPNLYFKTPAEIEAYEYHMKKGPEKQNKN